MKEKLSLKEKMILLEEMKIQFDSKGFENKLEKLKYKGFMHLLFIINELDDFFNVFKNQYPDHSTL